MRLWRPVGELLSIGVWRAATRQSFGQKVLATLPLWPWMTSVITELQSHPQ